MLAAFKKGEKPKPGPQSGRHTSENSAGLTALTEKVRIHTSPFLHDTDAFFVALRTWGALPARVRLEYIHVHRVLAVLDVEQCQTRE